MGEPLKDILFNRQSVEALARDLALHVKGFDPAEFSRTILASFPTLELKERATFIAAEMRRRLPTDYEKAVATILKSLPDDAGQGQMKMYDDFRYMPHLTFVELYGLDQPDLSLRALHRLTKYFTGEGAIRPYLIHHRGKTLTAIRLWVKDSDWRVRRLVSEGTRPRLPWAQRAPFFVADPRPVIDLLDNLKDDPNEIVRRSVANNLNDIAKDHPDVVASLARIWANGASVERMALLRHALRTLIKQGHPEALAILGFSGSKMTLVKLDLKPKKLLFGHKLTFSATIRNDATKGALVSLDYALHFLGSKGQYRRKVFKGAKIKMPPGSISRFEREHAIRPITTRSYYPGLHHLEILANGRSLGKVDFYLVME